MLSLTLSHLGVPVRGLDMDLRQRCWPGTNDLIVGRSRQSVGDSDELEYSRSQHRRQLGLQIRTTKGLRACEG